ncbi:MAG: hypothetical protein INR70_05220 [Parafilimonas terrae]|nr:hypothetical protein [Parafilimonas terrae]
MVETVRDYYRRYLSEEEELELDGHKDTMRSTAPSAVKAKAYERIKVLVEKAEATRKRMESGDA